MKTRIAVFVAMTAFVSVAAAQKAEKAEAGRAREAVEEINRAIIKGDYAKLIDRTYPKAIEMAGGRDKMIALVTKGVKEMNDKGISFLAVTVETPADFAESGSDRFTVVPYTLELKAPGGKLKSKTFMVGISGDNGKTWSFLDGAGASNPAMLKMIVPHFPKTLTLPQREKPTFEKDK